MSAAGRGAVRRDRDLYETPDYTIEALYRHLDGCWRPHETFLEPAVGGGVIVRGMCRAGAIRPSQWVGWDIAPSNDAGRLLGQGRCVRLDVTALPGDWPPAPCFDWAITNPPFSLTLEFLALMRRAAGHAVILQRLNFLGSLKRSEFWQTNMPQGIYVLSERPQFIDGATDATEYAWFHWHPDSWGRRYAEIEVLPPVRGTKGWK